jgi:hypothetical protein
MKIIAVIVVAFGLCTQVVAAPVAEPITADAYGRSRDTKGVVLLAVRWDRRWKCGGYENAQLRVIAFDKLPSEKGNDDRPDLVLDDAPRVMTKPAFDNYAFLVEPGEYGLSGLEIKVARSASDVGFFKAPRSIFMKEGKSAGGSFKVAAGEIVYIGHFYLDCAKQPTLWRYYPDGREAFSEYLSTMKKAFAMLDLGSAQFRLFQTTEFGNEYQLP